MAFSFFSFFLLFTHLSLPDIYILHFFVFEVVRSILNQKIVWVGGYLFAFAFYRELVVPCWPFHTPFLDGGIMLYTVWLSAFWSVWGWELLCSSATMPRQLKRFLVCLRKRSGGGLVFLFRIALVGGGEAAGRFLCPDMIVCLYPFFLVGSFFGGDISPYFPHPDIITLHLFWFWSS